MRLVRVFVHRGERGNCNLRLRRTPADKILNPCHFGIIVGSADVFFADVVGIVVASDLAGESKEVDRTPCIAMFLCRKRRT